MADLATTKLFTLFTRMLRTRLFRNLIGTMLCSRSYQAAYDAGAYTLQVPRGTTSFTITTETGTNFDRLEEIDSIADVNMAWTAWTPDQYTRGALRFASLDELQTPLPVMAVEAQRFAHSFSSVIDNYIFSTMHSSISSGTSRYQYVALAGTGTGNTRIPGHATLASAIAQGKNLLHGLRRLKATFAVNDAALTPGAPSGVWAVFHPSMIADLEAAFTDVDTTWEMIGVPTTRNGFAGRLFGIDIYVSNNVPRITTGSGNNAFTSGYHCPVGLTSATEFVFRVFRNTTFSASENQVDWSAARMLYGASYGAMVMDTQQLRGIRYAQSAS